MSGKASWRAGKSATSSARLLCSISGYRHNRGVYDPAAGWSTTSNASFRSSIERLDQWGRKDHCWQSPLTAIASSSHTVVASRTAARSQSGAASEVACPSWPSETELLGFWKALVVREPRHDARTECSSGTCTIASHGLRSEQDLRAKSARKPHRLKGHAAGHLVGTETTPIGLREARSTSWLGGRNTGSPRYDKATACLAHQDRAGLLTLSTTRQRLSTGSDLTHDQSHRKHL